MRQLTEMFKGSFSTDEPEYKERRKKKKERADRLRETTEVKEMQSLSEVFSSTGQTW